MTSSNTGHISGACIAIQEKLKRAVLRSGCRHHIGKVLLTYIFTDLNIEPSKSVDFMLFSRLRSNWELVANNPAETIAFLSADHTPEALELLASMKAEMVERTEQSEICA